MADPDYLTIQSSYLRCCASAGFFDTFYAIFLAKSPEIAEKFANTDFTRQKQMLRDSIFKMVRQASFNGEARAEVERIGELHARQFDIRPGLYALWLDSLCAAIKQHDPGYTTTLEVLWRRRMQQGIDLIIAIYQSRADPRRPER